MKKVLYNILYYLSLLLAALAVIGALYFGAQSLLNIFQKHNDILTIFNIPVSVLITGSCILIIFLCSSFRIWVRRFIDFDEFGNSKRYNSYDKLSRQEKNEIDKQKLADAERLVSTNVLMKMTHKGYKNPDEELNHLIGLKNAKKEVAVLKAKMMYEKKKNKKDRDSLHMCFMGNPGTGKTTVARIMASYLYKYGFIKKNKCLEIDGSFLHGRSQSETEEKITRIIQYALDGVLFIDEAYSIMDIGGIQDPTAVLIKAMEDKRDRLVIIFAGYNKEMKNFIQSNSGIFSRIKYYIDFEDYNLNELTSIFISMANQKGFKVSKSAVSEFKKVIQNEKENSPDVFGNARTVRNILEKSIDNHYYHLSINKTSKKNILQKIDIISDSIKI